jgi:hypothetical protein
LDIAATDDLVDIVSKEMGLIELNLNLVADWKNGKIDILDATASELEFALGELKLPCDSKMKPADMLASLYDSLVFKKGIAHLAIGL